MPFCFLLEIAWISKAESETMLPSLVIGYLLDIFNVFVHLPSRRNTKETVKMHLEKLVGPLLSGHVKGTLLVLKFDWDLVCKHLTMPGVEPIIITIKSLRNSHNSTSDYNNQKLDRRWWLGGNQVIKNSVYISFADRSVDSAPEHILQDEMSRYATGVLAPPKKNYQILSITRGRRAGWEGQSRGLTHP